MHYLIVLEISGMLHTGSTILEGKLIFNYLNEIIKCLLCSPGICKAIKELNNFSK